MWRNAIVDISKRARQRSSLPQLKNAVKAVAVDANISNVFAASTAASPFATNADMLSRSHDDFRAQVQTNALHTSLESSQKPLCAADDTAALLRSTEKLPFLYAQEVFCVLIKAGEIHLALQLTSFWQYRKPKRIFSQRQTARRELYKSIETLQKLGDAVTLKALIAIIAESLKEQAFAQKKALQSSSMIYSNGGCSPRMQNKLFALLGTAATSDVLICAVEAACRLTEENGMSTFEKLVLIDQCAAVTTSAAAPAGTPRLPYPLYHALESLLRANTIGSDYVRQVCPELPLKLVHPSHYTFTDVLTLSTKEAVYIQQHWSTKGILDQPLVQSTKKSPWHFLLRRVLAQSKPLQSAKEKSLLISLLAYKNHSAGSIRATDDETWKSTRNEVVALLKSPLQSVRRATASALFARKHLLLALKISPVAVASVYAQSFYSKDRADPALCAFCVRVIRHSCARGCYADAARLVCNHLSVSCAANAALFKSSSSLVDLSVLSVCRAMREASANGSGQKWMGYRSLALLRLAASSRGDITVMHCVPVCVNAMTCGVPFTSVNEAIMEVFDKDPLQRKWALNLIRLCSETETVPSALVPNRQPTATQFRRLLSKLCGHELRRSEKVTVKAPSRSKQLALWETLSHPHSNPKLNALMMAAFLSESTRNSILDCSFLSPSLRLKSTSTETPVLPPVTVSDIWNWEVAVSMAANCSSERSLQSFLTCLKQRRPHATAQSANQLDNVAAVMYSELEAYDLTLQKTAAQDK